MDRRERRDRWWAIDKARREANTYKRPELRAAFEEGFSEGIQRTASSPSRLMTRAEKVAWGKGYSAGAEWQT